MTRTQTPATSLLLASRSPRRRRLLAWLGIPFVCTEVDTPEDLDSPLADDPQALAISLATEKAEAAAALGIAEQTVLLCFDTIVVCDGMLLGKPVDTDDAWRMLRLLSGRTHEVVTGCVVVAADGEPVHGFAVTTTVTMRELDDARILTWMARGEYLGCAGAYNIESQIAGVEHTECYQNVAGIPLCHVAAALRAEVTRGALAVTPESPVPTCDAALGRTCALGPLVLG